MMASLFSGVSGLRNHQVKMNVIGNNIANVNTIGFKPGRVNFQETLVQTFKGAARPSAVIGGTNPLQLGMGMQLATIDNLFLQGGLETTGQITDLAIQGAGFFILADNNGNSFYTRAGAFGFDADSNMVDPSSGLFVQGKMADASGEIPSLATIRNITLPFGQQDPAQATRSVTFANNLDATASDSDASLVDTGGSSVQQVSGTAVNGVGGSHSIAVTGLQAVQSTYTGSNVGDDGTDSGTLIGALSPNTTLGSLNIDDFSISFSVDGGTAQSIPGLSASTTIQELINQINTVHGLTATLVGGEVKITRDYAGDTSVYNFASSVGNVVFGGGGEAQSGNIVGVVFGVNGTTIGSAGGAATTFQAVDTFTPDRGYGAAAGPETTNLGLVFDDNGMVVGLSGVGSGGIDVKTGASGLTATGANPLLIETDATLWSASINVFDSLGEKHTMTVQFFKSLMPNRWEWSVSMLGQEELTAGSSGFVSFNSDGSLNTLDYFGGATVLTMNPNNGADSMTIALDPGTIGSYDGLTQFASGSHTAAIIQQDGYGLGVLEKVSIDQSGNIYGIFSNGITRVLAQIMLADFNNEAGLRKAGRSLFQPTAPGECQDYHHIGRHAERTG